MNLVRKYLNYIIFGAVVLLVVGLAVNHSRHMRQLVDALSSPDPKAQEDAAAELINGEQFSDSITGEPVSTRVHAAAALEVLGADSSIKPPDPNDKDAKDLRAEAVKQCIALLKDTDKPVRDRAIQALEKMGASSPATLDALMGGLGDTDPYIHKGMMAALTEPAHGIGPKKEVVDAIIKKMTSDGPSRGPGGDVLSSPSFVKGGADVWSVPELIAVLTDKDPKNAAKYKNDEGARAGAADALGKIGDPKAVPVLIQVIEHDTEQVRRTAISAIGLIADQSGEDALVKAVEDPNTDSEARAQATAGLGKIASPRAIATLVKTLGDDDSKIRSAAVAALSRAGRPTSDAPVNPTALSALTAALQDPNDDVRLGATQALQIIAAPQADGALIAVLQKDKPQIKAAAAAALGFAGNKDAVTPLVSAMSDPSGDVDVAARDALAAIGPQATDALIALLPGGKTDAYYASQALVKQGTAALPALEKAAQSSNPIEQRWAAVALGELNTSDSTVTKILKQLESSPDQDVRYVAQTQLAHQSQAQ